jgi:methylenetetrahydrofolate reductase (NADPH)
MPTDLQTARQHAGATNGGDLSLEFFPPARADGIDRLVETARCLEVLAPRFISMTFGAGGSTRQRSVEAVAAFRAGLASPVAAHITCVAESRAVTEATIARFLALGIKRFVALRGDAPAEALSTSGFADAVSLVKALSARGVADISVACYPEVHPKAASPAADLEVLKAKFDAGATRAITQFFLDTSSWLRFRDTLAAHRLEHRVVPGVLLFEDFSRAASFAERCGTAVPVRLKERFARRHGDPRGLRAEALAFLGEQVAQLRDNGARHIHFYVLNKAELALDLLDRPAAVAGARAASAW